jgi:hypothetical protein
MGDAYARRFDRRKRTYAEAPTHHYRDALNRYRVRSQDEALERAVTILGVCSLATFAEPSVRYGHARAEDPVDC